MMRPLMHSMSLMGSPHSHPLRTALEAARSGDAHQKCLSSRKPWYGHDRKARQSKRGSRTYEGLHTTEELRDAIEPAC